MVRTAEACRFDRLIGFDMGGTSTDVCHYAGSYERSFETEVAGVRMRAPMMAIHTVAAGGGSVLRFADGRMHVGPESAGANPGPACYRRGGPLTVTDCNVLLGRIQPEQFPRVFGPDANQLLEVAFTDPDQMKKDFAQSHEQRFGFLPGTDDLVIDLIIAEAIGETGQDATVRSTGPSATAPQRASIHVDRARVDVPLIDRNSLAVGNRLDGPATCPSRPAPTSWRRAGRPRHCRGKPRPSPRHGPRSR